MLFLALSASSAEPTPEAKYLAARDGFIEAFKKTNVPVEVLDTRDKKALRELEKQLRAIIGPVAIKGYPEVQGTINLETLEQDGGFGQLDGLSFHFSEHDWVVVSTTGLVQKYIVNVSAFPRDFKRLVENEEFLTKAYSWDAHIYLYAELPLKKGKDFAAARAFLAFPGGDYGPYVPKNLIVFAQKGKRIFLCSSDVLVDVGRIPKCKAEYDSFEKKSKEAYDRYRTSKLKDKQAFELSSQIERDGYDAFRRCYGKNVDDERFFGPATKQAQSILDSLL